MKKLLTLLVAVIMAVACCFSLIACGEKDDNKTVGKAVALICLHGTESSYDKNFIDAFTAACKAKGLTESQYTIVTGVPEEGDDCYNKAADFADAGFKAVFADSFGHSDNMVKAAKEFPEVQFCHATGTATTLATTPANFHNAFASIYEGRYLAGVAAGLKLVEMYGDEDGNVSDENAKVGYVAAWPYAEVISGYTSWFLGVRSVVANATMQVRYTYSWYSVNGEKASAIALIEDGCKLISGHADSMGVPTACKERNIPNVFYNGTQPNEQFIIASKINWQPYFEIMIDNALNGTAIPKDYTGTIASGSVEITDLGPAAAAGTAAKLEEVKTAFANGFKVFDCSKFTVNAAKADASAFSKASFITMDEDGHLIAYNADVVDDGTYQGETNVIKTADGVIYFSESTECSAPYFDIVIDGISIGADVAYED